MQKLTFVIGCPRSGTYLLSSMLNHSTQIAIPTETHFVPLFSRFRRLHGDLSHRNARLTLLNSIYAFLKIWFARTERERDYSKIVRYSLLETQVALEAIASKTGSYQDIVKAIFQEYSVKVGANMSGDKSAFFDHQPIELIDDATDADSKYLHVVRDGRDVCLSWMQLTVGPKSVMSAAREWRQHVVRKRIWGKRNPERYLEVRYEDLLSDPSRELRRICDFIEIAFDPRMLEFHTADMSKQIANSTTHRLLMQPLDINNVGKWSSKMAHSDLQEFEFVAGDALLESGYSLSATTSPKLTLVCFLRCKYMVCIAREAVSFNSIRRRLKNMLPAVLLISGRLGLDLDRVVNSKLWLKVEVMFERRWL